MSELIKINLGSLAQVGNGLPVQGQAGAPTVTATVVGVGAVSAGIVIRGSNDGVAWVPLVTLNLTGTNQGIASGGWSGDYAQLRMDVVSISPGSVASAMVAVDQTQAVSSGGVLQSNVWASIPSISRLRVVGTGALSIDSRSRGGVVSASVFTGNYGNTPETIEFPYYGDAAIEIRATFPATLTVEVI